LQRMVAGVTAADPDLEKCRRLFEKYRQFVRLAGKATRAAAAAPTGVAPVAVAQKILVDSAKETLKQTPSFAGPTGNFAEGPPAAVAMKPTSRAGRFAGTALGVATTKIGTAGRAVSRDTPAGVRAETERVCSVCELPSGSCRCRKFRRTGRWFRNGSSIIVHC
jgi:hypothetical protein